MFSYYGEKKGKKKRREEEYGWCGRGGGGCSHVLKITVEIEEEGGKQKQKKEVQNSLQCHFGKQGVESRRRACKLPLKYSTGEEETLLDSFSYPAHLHNVLHSADSSLPVITPPMAEKKQYNYRQIDAYHAAARFPHYQSSKASIFFRAPNGAPLTIVPPFFFSRRRV